MKPSLGTSLFIFSLCMASLASWQLNKAWNKFELEKEQSLLQTSTQTLDLSEALSLWKKKAFSIQGLNIKTEGSLEFDQFLLHDNRVYKSKAGYGVYTLLKLKASQSLQTNSEYSHLLVNMGWIAIPHHDRSKAPDIVFKPEATAEPQISLGGKIEVIHTDLFQLGKQPLEEIKKSEDSLPTIKRQSTSQQQIRRMQYIDFEQLNETFNIQLLPFVVHSKTQLTTEKLPALDTHIRQRGISAAKHLGYGLQWLCFLFIGWGIFFYTRSKKSN